MALCGGLVLSSCLQFVCISVLFILCSPILYILLFFFGCLSLPLFASSLRLFLTLFTPNASISTLLFLLQFPPSTSIETIMNGYGAPNHRSVNQTNMNMQSGQQNLMGMDRTPLNRHYSSPSGLPNQNMMGHIPNSRGMNMGSLNGPSLYQQQPQQPQGHGMISSSQNVQQRKAFSNMPSDAPPGPRFDVADFPTLGDTFGSAQALPPLTQQQQQTQPEFQIQSEDFPALGAAANANNAASSSNGGLSQQQQQLGGPVPFSRAQSGPASSSGQSQLHSNAQGPSPSHQPQPSPQNQSQQNQQQGSRGPPQASSSSQGQGQGQNSQDSSYGLTGLLNVIRMTNPDLNTLALGTDLTTLGLNLNSHEYVLFLISFLFLRGVEMVVWRVVLSLCFCSPFPFPFFIFYFFSFLLSIFSHSSPSFFFASFITCFFFLFPPLLLPCLGPLLSISLSLTRISHHSFQLSFYRALYATFSYPCLENPTKRDPDYVLPYCYYMQPPALKTSHLGKFHVETLFYIFYSMPKDTLQLYAAKELYKRDWKYHKQLQLWFTKPSENMMQKVGYQKGSYIYFDINLWERRLFHQQNFNGTLTFMQLEEFSTSHS